MFDEGLVMTRKQQIIEQAKHEDSDGYFGFISGAEWADDNPISETFIYSDQKFIQIELQTKMLTKSLNRIYRLCNSYLLVYIEDKPKIDPCSNIIRDISKECKRVLINLKSDKDA